MIFLRYESFRSYLRHYPGTVALVILNLLAFAITLVMGNEAYNYGAFLTHAAWDPFGLQEPWRYLTAMFMHADFGHLFYNMFALIVFAPPLEYLLKTVRYVPFYLACGIGGSLISAAVHAATSSGLHAAVGASGAIYGVYGAFLFIALYRKAMLDPASRTTVIIILAFGVLHSLLVARIDLWGHIGGALTGFACYSFLDRLKHGNNR